MIALLIPFAALVAAYAYRRGVAAGLTRADATLEVLEGFAADPAPYWPARS